MKLMPLSYLRLRPPAEDGTKADRYSSVAPMQLYGYKSSYCVSLKLRGGICHCCCCEAAEDDNKEARKRNRKRARRLAKKEIREQI